MTAGLIGGSSTVTFGWFRWGGGAEPGRTHLFRLGLGCSPIDFSWQCVVDDFGNLVVVPS